VVLSDNADDYVVADAVRFVKGVIPIRTQASNVVGDNGTIGTYGYYVTGHGENSIVECLDCHDAHKDHIDHQHRTYEAGVTDYSDSYRLMDITGQPAMNVPRPLYAKGTPPIDHWEDFALCFECHDRNEVLLSSTSSTNFWHNDSLPQNSHFLHMQIYSNNFDSDWNGIGDSSDSCIACHNVHGSPTAAMTRHGELISTYGTTDKVPALNFSYLAERTDYDTATWTPNFSAAGSYDVYAWWYAKSDRANNVTYTIYYNGGSATINNVNQRINGSQWNRLGTTTYPFAVGTSGYVEITTEGINGYVIADAIGWDTNTDGTPDIIVDNGGSGFAYVGDWNYRTGFSQSWNNDHHAHAIPIPGTPDPDTTRPDSVGGIMDWGPTGDISYNHVCGACHGGPIYVRDPKVIPQP
jgi:hypothetical protein